MHIPYRFLYVWIGLLSLSALAAENVAIRHNQLVVDGVSQPEIFGAEIQYFRLRGGEEKNIPRAKVLEIWNRALDHAVEAGMNAVSFYIPWDFHEYKEGHFDFTGTVDEDGDGNPDYPSRDVVTFIQLIEAHGIHRIMVRPGPYINAEWGFLGFGAIPLWFHEKYPDSHMRNADGLRTKLYDYHNADLLEHTRLWFNAVYAQVLKKKLGKNGPILFLQIDNETNFMWQSIYNHDYGTHAVERYQDSLRAEYGSLKNLNLAHGRNWSAWNLVKPPVTPGLNIEEDRAWYRFQDGSIYSYLKILRTMWEEIGVKEPEVIFTLAESYNAMKNGILPQFHNTNDPGKTGMMTMNLYPKTYELPNSPLMNLPFKADHDVLAMDSAKNAYLGKKEEWLMGPEIQGGWWKGVPVTDESRLQTYLSTVGRGLKAMFIYYFSEGDNWQNDWVKKQVKPIYDGLRSLPEYLPYRDGALPDVFWKTLQSKVDHQVLVGIDVYRIMNDDSASSPLLYFDAPLDHNANPQAHFSALKEFGQKVIQPHRHFLARSIRVSDPVVIMKDDAAHAPSPIAGIDSMLMNAEWAGGLVGYLAQAGISPTVHHWNLNDKSELGNIQVIFHQDPGVTNPEMSVFYEHFMKKGGTVVSFLGHSLARSLGLSFTADQLQSNQAIKVHSLYGHEFEAAAKPLETYSLTGKNCSPVLFNESRIIGFKCQIGMGTFIQIGALFYDIFNSDWYGVIADSGERISFLKSILKEARINPLLKMSGPDQVTAFAREGKTGGHHALWITVKNGRPTAVDTQIELTQPLMQNSFRGLRSFKATALMGKKSKQISISKKGTLPLSVHLKAYGSEVFFIENTHD